MEFNKIFLACSVLLFLVVSCDPNSKEKRPSPYANDSTLIGDAKIHIKYSSPGVKKRKIWGDLVPYGNMWRTGANEATLFQTSKDITLNGQVLPAGKYSVFAIPDAYKWILIFNKDWNQWGAYNYDESKDALRLEIKPQKTEVLQERMKFSFIEQKLVFQWEYLTFDLGIETL
ncbi:MAG: DUF2911 domain-containing protein [Cyclobacteriaceae bacterium]